MNQKGNQSKEQLDSELLQLSPTKALPEETLIALLQSGDSQGLEEAQKYIDEHIKKQCDAKGADFWDYYLDETEGLSVSLITIVENASEIIRRHRTITMVTIRALRSWRTTW